MKVVIIWNSGYQELKNTMEKLITENDCYLFTIICGGTDESSIGSSLGYQWAKDVGLPVEYLIDKNIEELLNKIAQTADYLVCYNDGSQVVGRLIMKFRAAEKHGTVINDA